MNKLFIGSLLAFSTTGCVITGGNNGGGGEEATLTAGWTFKELAADRITGCPAGFDTVRLYTQPVTPLGAVNGELTIDIFDCADGLVAVPLYPDLYQVWVEATDFDNTQLYAQSLSAIVDLIDVDKRFDATILHDGGYFIFDWALQGAQSNQALSCADVNPDSIEIISTLSSSTDFTVDKFNCEQGTGVTGGLLAGAYEVSVDAEIGGEAIGVAPAVSTSIRDRNQVTDLGAIIIPIDNL